MKKILLASSLLSSLPENASALEKLEEVLKELLNSKKTLPQQMNKSNEIRINERQN